jgi:HEAT repeat protein
MTSTTGNSISGVITGREPRLSTGHSKQGERRLSLRGLATMLNALPPEAVSLEAVAAALRSPAFFVRYNAAVVLARRGDRDARVVMQEALTEGEAPTRATVARQLYAFSWFAAEPLIRGALADSDPRVREGAVYALCDMGDLNAYQLLAEALQHETDTVRSAAAWGLRECEDPAAVPVLAAVLKAKDPDVRVQALETLGVNGSPEAVPLTAASLHDPDPDVQYAATLSLLELVGESALPDLADLIRQSGGASREAILRGLFHATNYLGIEIGDDAVGSAVLDALEVAMQDDLPDVRMAAAWPLAWIRAEHAPALLRAAYEREQDSEVRAHIMRVAVSLMSVVGDDLFRDALHSTDSLVRQVAQEIEQARSGHAIPHYDAGDTRRHGLSTPRLEDSESD